MLQDRRIDIDKNGFAPGITNRRRCRHEGVANRNHFVPRLIPGSQHCQMKRTGSGINTKGKLGLAIFCKLLFEASPPLGPRTNCTLSTTSADGVIDFVFNRLVLCFLKSTKGIMLLLWGVTYNGQPISTAPLAP